MCGIIASINKDVYNILINGLMQLQNRGYDSAGITIIQNEKFNTIKKASSNEENAIDYLKLTKIKGNIGIGHTRWATHGAKTDQNSHPHISNCGKFSLVHNGIIENYQNLKDFLIKEGYKMYSETDTEIIVNLISFYYKTNSIIDSIKQCVNKLEGTWGLVILCVDDPNSLYTTRFGSPLLVGYDDNTAIITSEKSGFCNLINNYFVLSNHDKKRI